MGLGQGFQGGLHVQSGLHPLGLAVGVGLGIGGDGVVCGLAALVVQGQLAGGLHGLDELFAREGLLLGL